MVKSGFRLGMVLLCASVLPGCGEIDPDSPLGQRKAAFRAMLDVSEELGGMMRGRVEYDEQRFVEQAVRLDELSRRPWQHFPSVKDDKRTAARDEVWQRQEQFSRLARDLESRTAGLAGYVQGESLDKESLAEHTTKIEQACKTCHQEFRSR